MEGAREAKREKWLKQQEEAEYATESSANSSDTEIEEEMEVEFVYGSAGLPKPVEKNNNNNNTATNGDSFLYDPARPGPPKLPFSEQKYKHKIRKDTWTWLVEKAGSQDDAEKLLIEVLRCYRPETYEKLTLYTSLVNNIQSVFSIYEDAIRGTKKLGSTIATELTTGLSTKKASALTGYSERTINLRKQEKHSDPSSVADKATLPPSLSAPSLSAPNTVVPKERGFCGYCGGGGAGCKYCRCEDDDMKFAKSDEDKWFVEWSWRVAPKGHSNDPKRRFIWTTWKDAFDAYKKSALVDNVRAMGYTWFKSRVDGAKIRCAKFDKYRCEHCFQGLTAIAKQLKGMTFSSGYFILLIHSYN